MVAISKALPQMGLGMAALGRPGYINLNRSSVFDNPEEESAGSTRTIAAMQGQANSVMDCLLKEASKRSLMPWFDCARSYGLSEKFVGDFLRENNVKPEEVYVSSKWGYTYVADWKVTLEGDSPHEVKDHSTENFLKQIDETIDQIGEYVDLYQVHSATFKSGVLSDSRLHGKLFDCKQKRGWAIGLSVSGPDQDEILREAMKIKSSDGVKLFDSVQCTYNILEQRPFPALLEAHEEGMDIIIKEGMANGRIFQSKEMKEFSETSGYPLDQLALACILAQPFRPRVLSGSVTDEQLVSNLQALNISEELKNERKELLTEIMQEASISSEQYWTDRSNLGWN